MKNAALLGLALTGALALPAGAADWYGGSEAPAPATRSLAIPVPVWAGFYAGVNLGYGWATASDQLACTSATCIAMTSAPFGGVSAVWLARRRAVRLQLARLAGYSPLVLGIETDVQASSVYGQGSDAAGDFFHSRLEALGTVRGRVGYALDCTLLYFTGGLAWGTILNEANLGATSGADYYTNPTVTGYVLGGGVEYKFWRDLSVKVEYQYVNLGKNNPVDIATGTGTYTANGGALRDDAFNTVRVGLNWWPFGNYVPLPLK